MKRAFCEPGNSASNPPLRLAVDLCLGLAGTFAVPDAGLAYARDGGEGAMVADFAADTLTPQLLKPALSAFIAT